MQFATFMNMATHPFIMSKIKHMSKMPWRFIMGNTIFSISHKYTRYYDLVNSKRRDDESITRQRNTTITVDVQLHMPSNNCKYGVELKPLVVNYSHNYPPPTQHFATQTTKS